MKKTSKTKISKTYAMALYEAASGTKSIDKVLNDIEKLRTLLKEDASVCSYLSSPLWADADKKDVLAKSAKILHLSEETLACLDLVTENRRIAELMMILDDFVKIYYQKSGVAEVDVETVKKLTAKQDKSLTAVLEKLFAKKVVINYIVNPAVAGGLRVKYESKMFDDSLASKLNYLENVMKGK